MDADLLTPHGPAWSGATVLVVDDEVLVGAIALDFARRVTSSAEPFVQ